MLAEHNFNLRPFQQEVFDCIMKGKKRVILQAPTGAGKTQAALAPFIHHLGHKADREFPYERLPLTCRYAVPMRTLANQFYRDYHDLAKLIDDAMPTRLEDEYKEIGRVAVSIQTGEQSNDAQMESALTFCTIDQLLAGSIAIPYGLGKNLANINVAAVAGSYLILDEFHLYPLMRAGKSCFGALTTTIKMLSLLKEITPFVLMTATFSSTLLNRLAKLLDAEVVTVTDPNELAAIADGRIRMFERSSLDMNAQTILSQHKHCSLVVCNTVARAQKMWSDLKEETKRDKHNIDVVLLHSRFTEQRREKVAKDVERELGPAPKDKSCGWENGNYYGRNIIVVATQVIEVGLNISVETLHTEIAPASSIIQRAGRCARFKNQQGRVIIYPLTSDTEKKKTSYLPYDNSICEATWGALERVDQKVVGFNEEQELINKVHEESDKEMLKLYDDNHGKIFDMIVESFNKNDSGVSSELIRDVVQVQVLIHDTPNDSSNGITETPWLWQSFSMHPRSLEKWFKSINQAKEQGKLTDVEWICLKAETYMEGDPNEPDNKLKMKCKWVEITNTSLLMSAAMVVVPSRLAHYNDDIGFMLLDGTSDGGTYQSVKRPIVEDQEAYKGSRQQSYLEHITGLVTAYNSHLYSETRYVMAKLEKAMHLSEGIIDHAIRLAIACHDLGKLDRQWQQWARTWQPFVMKMLNNTTYQLPDKDFLFAKTEYDYSKRQREWQKQIWPKRPHHACESVMLGRKLIGMSLGVTKIEGAGKEKQPLLRAVCGAIARHHTSQAYQYSTAHLDKVALNAIDEALKGARSNKPWSYDLLHLSMNIDKGDDLTSPENPTPLITRPDNDGDFENTLETLLYFVIVRALRLADQRA